MLSTPIVSILTNVRKGGYNVKQIISKDGRVLCVTTVPYSKETIKQMKKSGYKITNKEC